MMNQTRIGALLHEDHLATLRTLHDLDAFLGRHAKAPPDLSQPAAREMLAGLRRTVADEVDRHFGFEEEHLFPRLAERGEGMIGEVLRQEHAVILPLARELCEAIAAAEANGGFDDAGWRRFRGRAAELVERETFHIQKEEMGLLAAISMLLDEAADAALAEEYAALKDGEGG